MTGRSFAWYFWVATIAALVVGIFVTPLGIWAAVALTAIQTIIYLARGSSLSAFPVQVRLAYILLLLLGLSWGPLVFILWIQLAGTTALVTVGYCPLARFLSLMPWNRERPFSLAVVRETFLSPPVKGSIQDHFNGPAAEKPLE